MTKAEQIARERFPEDLYGFNREDLIFGFIEGYKYAKKRLKEPPMKAYRKTVTERLNDIRSSISKAKDGFDPFASRSRDKVIVCWRQCIWRQLTKEGYHANEVAKATNYDHATIWYSMQRLDDYLYCGDPLAVATWKDLQAIIEPRYYGN